MCEYNHDIIDEIMLAFLYFNYFEDNYGKRAWKSLDWDAMGRLHQKGYISDPKSKAKSISITDEAIALGEKLAKKYFQK